MTLKTIKDCKEIDLKKHGLIEASAGTGKTYIIENLVVRLLKENSEIALENILLVTFTEKATCELKIRIREKIEKELKNANDSSVIKKLRDSLDTFDTASIFTIHGFCRTVLSDFAFENSVLLKSELIDDQPLFETKLKEQMRKTWPEKYGEDLPEILADSGFSSKKEGKKFSNTVLAIAGKTYRENAGDLLLPDIENKSFKQLQNEIKALILKLKTLTGVQKCFSEQFEKLNINARAKKSLLNKIVIPLEKYLSNVDDKNIDIAGLQNLISQIQGVKSGQRQGVQCLVPDKWLKKEPNPEVCPNLRDIISVLQKIEEASANLKQMLAIETIHQLQNEVSMAKAKKGRISFDDMINLVEKALYNDNSDHLLTILRHKYKVAFVDEFQDTDPVQWKIFKKIFLDNHKAGSEVNSNNVLFLIGDPKQAIYSFRGADVFAYLNAKNEIEELSKQQKAGLYILDINWRSQPELINAFNSLFGRKEWFKPGEQAGKFEICYQDAGFPGKKDRLTLLSSDESGRGALNIVDLGNASSPSLAKLLLAKFIATEIRHLICCGNIKLIQKEQSEKKLSPGDICILIRAKSDVPLIESELSSLAIPYTYYKKPGLFQSDEALYLNMVFRAILDPGNSADVKKALLTPFFGFKPADLYAYEQLPHLHRLKQLLFKWNEYALSRSLSILFQSLINDSGLLFREAEKVSWDRKHTNYRQIFEHLEEMAYLKNLDFRQITSMLAGYRKDTVSADENADIHQIETEEEKVQIMTMHVSKGLQFPVVFIAGGLTQRSAGSDNCYIYHKIVDKNNLYEVIKTIDLSRQTGKEKHFLEKTDEDKRLYYVASTRAEHKLYLPYYSYDKKYSWVGPVCCLLSPALSNAFPKDDEKKKVLWLSPDKCCKTKVSMMQDEQNDLPVIEKKEVAEPFPFTRNFIHKKIKLESFSSLNHKSFFSHKNVNQGKSFLSLHEKSKEDDESFASQKIDIAAADIIPDEMPGGAEIGSMFHDILELVDFKTVYTRAKCQTNNAGSLIDDPEIGDIILRQMDIYRVDKCWQQHICRILSNTLITPVRFIDDEFVLGRLSKENRLHEIEFYYPFSLPVDDNKKIPDCKITNGFIKGFIDLIFKYAGKYYIADWKSNYIEDGYSRDAMKVNMDHANYHLQYKLYTIALMRWLKQALGNRFNPVKDFGGVFYFYLRGMEPETENGIYHVPGEKLGSLDRLEKEITEILMAS
ncbi:MAG: UvrD-helicase domain-containing protein [Deltaproteobacteria bacterium]|nr:UvrD-helicase domain-containing protein [Deltaproteobacteria bacterium]MBW2662144.1 UvrD-helicase domain-containing protein [Deltaproteobacteria bacterium]